MMLLVALLAIGRDPDAIRQDVEERIPMPSEWVLEWIEFDGSRHDWAKGKGALVMEQKGGRMDCFSTLIYQLPLHHVAQAGRHFQVDFLSSDRSGKPGVFPGILRFDGSQLLVCVTDPSRNRPTEFATCEGDGRFLLSFKRKK